MAECRLGLVANRGGYFAVLRSALRTDGRRNLLPPAVRAASLPSRSVVLGQAIAPGGVGVDSAL